MVHESRLIPAPHAHHAELLARLAPGITHRIAAGAGRGLVVVQMLAQAGSYRSGFSPAKQVDLAHVMAMEVPEEVAVEVTRTVKEYDDLSNVPVLMTERAESGKVSYSFMLLDVRPHDQAGGETKH